MGVVHTLFVTDEVNEMIGTLICSTKAKYQIWDKWAHKYNKNTVLSSFRMKLFLMKIEIGSYYGTAVERRINKTLSFTYDIENFTQSLNISYVNILVV